MRITLGIQTHKEKKVQDNHLKKSHHMQTDSRTYRKSCGEDKIIEIQRSSFFLLNITHVMLLFVFLVIV